MTKIHQDEDDKRTGRIIITTFIVSVLSIAAIVHASDRNATHDCQMLAIQAEQFDDFYLPEWQQEMCDSVGVEVVVRFSPETRAEMAAAQTAAVEVTEGSESNVAEMEQWYQRQAYAREKEMAYLNLAPRLQRICACESVGRPDAVPQHYEADGVTVLTGRITPEDKGMCQINEYFWGAKAESLGLDLLDPFDNVQMANYIYQQQGAQPWYPSKKCHGYDA